MQIGVMPFSARIKWLQTSERSDAAGSLNDIGLKLAHGMIASFLVHMHVPVHPLRACCLLNSTSQAWRACTSERSEILVRKKIKPPQNLAF
jgi:hypothetical protein